MSTSQEIANEIKVRFGGMIHRDALRALTHSRYVAAGANGGLFGGRNPYMRSEGDWRHTCR